MTAVLDLNRSAQTLIGKPAASILARPIVNSWEAWAHMIAPHSAGASQAELCIDKDGDRHHYEVKWSPLNHRDQLVGRVVALRDVTDRVHMEENLRRQTLTDDLTGLPNRSMFMDRLNDAIRQARRRSGAVFAVMVLDLDRFKLINDSIGHQAGDVLLQSVATKLKRCVREVDTVARMGGDEFMILLHEMTSARDVLPILERMQEELKTPVYFRRQEMSAACSTGVVIWNPSYKDPEDLLRAADTAMYQAKEAGRGLSSHLRRRDAQIGDANPPGRDRSARGHQTAQLLTCISANRRTQHGQSPVVGSPHSLASPRARHAPPDEFITIAENSGLIVPVGEIAMEEVCSQITGGSRPKTSPPGCRSVSICRPATDRA
jgi:Amt family ammonium transporter